MTLARSCPLCRSDVLDAFVWDRAHQIEVDAKPTITRGTGVQITVDESPAAFLATGAPIVGGLWKGASPERPLHRLHFCGKHKVR